MRVAMVTIAAVCLACVVISVDANCLNHPCKHGGTCDQNTKKCVCVAGRVGKRCQNWACTAGYCDNDKKVCEEIHKNNGKVKKLQCVCEDEAYKGDDCDQLKDCMEHNPCEHGACQEAADPDSGLITSQICVCEPGYEGDRCQTQSTDTGGIVVNYDY